MPVQKYGIPLINRRLDLMACAQTGSGKTVSPPLLVAILQAAFLLPIISRLLRDGDLATGMEAQQQPRALVIAPTRELVRQIFNEARKLTTGTVCSVQIAYGGTSSAHQKAQIASGNFPHFASFPP
jgi:superfamily II DNA/RNA helicase